MNFLTIQDPNEDGIKKKKKQHKGESITCMSFSFIFLLKIITSASFGVRAFLY